jgi:hypothetical protein
MSLVYYAYLGKAALPSGAKVGACVALVAGILLQSGGFFWSAFVDKSGRMGTRMTTAGAVLLAGASLVLAYGLICA